MRWPASRLAAALAARRGVPVREVPAPLLKEALRDQGAVIDPPA